MVGATGNGRISHRRLGPLKDPYTIDEGERNTKIVTG